MDLESLQQGDQIVITNTKSEQYKAGFIEFTEDGLMVDFTGFGNLEVKWDDIEVIEIFMDEHKKDDTFYGPRYKATLWKQS